MNNISWYLVKEEIEPIDSEKYIGSFAATTMFDVKIRIWNNRWGTEACDDIEDLQLILQFESIEDSSILNFIHVTVDGIYSKTMDVCGNKGYISTGRRLSGNINDGGEAYVNNYIDVELKIIENLAVNNLLKNMYIDIVT